MSNRKDLLPEEQAPLRAWLGRVAILYLAGVILYGALSAILCSGPIVVIDESLYTNIARSLAWEGKIAYRGQPVNYPYILYPLLLVPVYRLQALLGGDIYRWVQAVNALLVCSSVFPVFLLGASFTKSKRKGFLAAALTLLIADMLTSSLLMTEALLWPLALWMMYFAWRLISEGKTKDAAMTGLFAGLMFFTKPGAVAMGAAILAAALILAFRQRTAKKPPLVGIGVLLGVIALVYIGYTAVFGYDFSLLGLYDKQTSDWQTSHLLAAGAGFIGMWVAFAMSGAVAVILLPYFCGSSYTPAQRRMLWMTTPGLAAVILGVAVFVIPYGWDGQFSTIPLHLRYVSMYLPCWFVFNLALEPEKTSLGKGFFPTLGCVTGGALVLGLLMANASTGSSKVDKLCLAAFTHCSGLDGTVPGTVFTLFVTAFCLWIFFTARKKLTTRIQNASFIALAAALAFNTCCGALSLRLDTGDGQVADAVELNRMITDEESALGVTQRNYSDIYSYWEEAHLTKPLQQVTSDQMFVSMTETGGVYRSFVPMDQAPNVNCGPTPEEPVLVLGQTIAEHLTLSGSVKAETTANGYYTVVTLTPGERWVDSMMYGIAENLLTKETDAAVCFFGSDSVGKTLKISVNAPSQETTFTFTQSGKTIEYTVSGEATVEIPVEGTWIEFSSDKDMYVYGYTVE